MSIVAWTPPDWVCNCFPTRAADQVEMQLSDLISLAHAHLDTVTEADTTARSAVLHVAHILVTLQSDDGLWPSLLDLRTGEALDDRRSDAPIALFRRLNLMLESTEFEPAIRYLATRRRARIDAAPG